MDFDELWDRLLSRTRIWRWLKAKRPSRDQVREACVSVFDLLIILSVALLALALDNTPAPFQENLALFHDNPGLMELWSTHFVHSLTDPKHLSANLKGFIVLGMFAYAVSLEVGARKSFKIFFAALFLIVAPSISITNLVLLEPTARLIDPNVADISNRGLSAMNSGLIGYLLIASAALVRDRLPLEMPFKTAIQLAAWGGMVLVLWEMYEVFGTQLWFIGLPILLLIAISIFGLGLSLQSLIPRVDADSRREQAWILVSRAWQWLKQKPVDHGGMAFMAAAGFFTVIVLVGDLITLPPLIDGKNTIGHASGLIFGTALAWLVITWEDV